MENFNKKIYYYTSNNYNYNNDFDDILNYYLLGYSLDKICLTYLLKHNFIIKNSISYAFKLYIYFTKRIPIHKNELKKLSNIIYDIVFAIIINNKDYAEFITLIDLFLYLEPIKGNDFLNFINKYN
jgi:hypothetical protein